MEIPPDLARCHALAQEEFAEKDLPLTGRLLESPGFERDGAGFRCVRCDDGDDGCAFYFKLAGKSGFYRVLVARQEPLVWSGKLVGAVEARLEMGQVRDARDAGRWLGYFPKDAESVLKDGKLSVRVPHGPALGADELAEAYASASVDDPVRPFADLARENEVRFVLDKHVLDGEGTELELEKWTLLELAKKRLSLSVRWIRE